MQLTDLLSKGVRSDSIVACLKVPAPGTVLGKAKPLPSSEMGRRRLKVGTTAWKFRRMLHRVLKALPQHG